MLLQTLEPTTGIHPSRSDFLEFLPWSQSHMIPGSLDTDKRMSERQTPIVEWIKAFVGHSLGLSAGPTAVNLWS
jgi:hypothetical protein